MNNYRFVCIVFIIVAALHGLIIFSLSQSAANSLVMPAQSIIDVVMLPNSTGAPHAALLENPATPITTPINTIHPTKPSAIKATHTPSIPALSPPSPTPSHPPHPTVTPLAQATGSTSTTQTENNRTTNSGGGTNTSESENANSETITEPIYRGGYLNNPQPEYPLLSREFNESGTVEILARISVQGLPLTVSVFKSSGYTRLDKAAVNTVKTRWRFIPAKRGNTPIVYDYTFPITFELK